MTDDPKARFAVAFAATTCHRNINAISGLIQVSFIAAHLDSSGCLAASRSGISIVPSNWTDCRHRLSKRQICAVQRTGSQPYCGSTGHRRRKMRIQVSHSMGAWRWSGRSRSRGRVQGGPAPCASPVAACLPPWCQALPAPNARASLMLDWRRQDSGAE